MAEKAQEESIYRLFPGKTATVEQAIGALAAVVVETAMAAKDLAADGEGESARGELRTAHIAATTMVMLATGKYPEDDQEEEY